MGWGCISVQPFFGRCFFFIFVGGGCRDDSPHFYHGTMRPWGRMTLLLSVSNKKGGFIAPGLLRLGC